MKKTSKYQSIIEDIFHNFSNVVVIIKDNYNFEYINRIGINLLGYKLEDMLNMNFIELLTPDSLEVCIENIRKLRKTGLCQPFKVNLLKKNGEILSLEFVGTQLDKGHFLFTGRNLSFERSRKEKMKYLQELSNNILNSIEEGIVVLDPKGTIIKFNHFMVNNSILKKTDIGKNVFKLFPNLKKLGLMDAFVTIIDKGINLKRDHIMGTSKDGKQTLRNYRGYPLKGEDKTKGAVIILEDAAEKQEISEQIKRTSELREKVQNIIESTIHLNTVPEILDSLIIGFKKILGYERGAIFLVKSNTGTLKMEKLFSSINTKRELKTAGKKIEKKLSKSSSLFKQVLEKGKSIIINNTQKDIKRIFPDTKSVLMVPIKTKNKNIGLITIYSKQKNYFDRTSLRAIEILSENTATTIMKAILYDNLLDKLKYLSTLYEISQMLHRDRLKERKTRYGNILKHISHDLPNFTILIYDMNKPSKESIVSITNDIKKVKNSFLKMTDRNRKMLKDLLNSGDPYIVENMKRKRAQLFKKLNKKNIKTFYSFPVFSNSHICWGFVLLGLTSTTLRKDQITFLTAISNHISTRISSKNENNE